MRILLMIMVVLFVSMIAMLIYDIINNKDETAHSISRIFATEGKFKCPLMIKVVPYDYDTEIGKINVLTADGHEYVREINHDGQIFIHNHKCTFCSK